MAWQVVLILLGMVGLPIGLTLSTVRIPGTFHAEPEATPYGYTVSLSLFAVPIVAMGVWFARRRGADLPKRAFWRTILILAALGWGLDIVFARWFFVFPNPKATLGIPAPALGAPVPIEEYVFYFTGFVAILLIYIWMDEFWLSAYKAKDYAASARTIPRLLTFHWWSAALGVALVAAGILYKKAFSRSPQGFPGYFTVLVIGGLVPSAGFFETARRFINWRALCLTLFLIVLVSLVWEATLALPYGWWGYQDRQMVGLFIGAWSGLPVEAVLVWIAVSYGTVIVFEIVKLWQALPRSAREAFFGAKILPPPEPADRPSS